MKKFIYLVGRNLNLVRVKYNSIRTADDIIKNTLLSMYSHNYKNFSSTSK